MHGLPPGPEAPSRQRRYWTAMRRNAHLKFTVTLARGRSRCCRRRHRPHAHHSSPHPRAVQLLLIDQQIASALPLTQ